MQVETLPGKELTNPPEVSFELLLVTIVAKRKQRDSRESYRAPKYQYIRYKEEAERFYERLKHRMEHFGLSLAEEKSRLIEFGRFAEANGKKRGEGKPETFDFLGFTHY